MSVSKSIGIIIGSTRAARIGPKVAELVKSVVEGSVAGSPTAPTFTLIDLKDFKLPVFDEALLPAMVPAYGEFQHQHSKDWTNEIQKYDGYILVSPEYNYGIPGGVKNAIDFLYHAWIGKPILIVTYGIFGGSASSDALVKTLEGMKLSVAETRPQLSFPDRDEANRNMSPSLMSSMSGELHETAKEQWSSGANKDLILKGYGELATKLESKKEDSEEK
ncbi:hypothetical protein V495_02762 [Pseudogymnoascus sp. VKM F-4514 (FW-929)]|nr:hypothetical protein V490_00927 [Pseudogymnoascus sp. VKM F-3557]KFY45917.1 hypothetical protein V495_02762 [Pseudogymnoascus sp. VKM F-4514 (FW-929)]KFY59411.1 hypothetical protein V497_04323 [Pseudogymnoascus sp. VKM F-4516 (FW-969)]